MEKVKILGQKFKGEFTTPGCIQKHKEAVYRIEAAARSIDLDRDDEVETIVMLCEKTAEILDDFFGKGAAVKILGKEPSLTNCLDAFAEFVQMYDLQIAPHITKKNEKVMESIRKRNSSETG